MNIYVAYGRTESDDELPVLGWHGAPTDAEVLAAYKRVDPSLFDEDGTFLATFSVSKIEMA